MDCGPTCLKMVFNYYGLKLKIETLRNETQIAKNGVSLLALSTTAEKYGFITRAIRISYADLLNEAPLPCILHWNDYHVVVLTPNSNKKKIVISDPAKGIVKYTKDEFISNWSKSSDQSEAIGIALLLEPGIAFYQKKENLKEDTSLNWNIIGSYLGKFKKHIFQLFLGLFLGSLLQLIFPFLTQSVVDIGINSQSVSFIQLILIAQFTLFFAQTGIDFVRSRILLFISQHLNISILSDYWVKLLKLPISFFESKNTGDLLQRINDHRRIESFITGTVLSTIFSIFSFVVFIVVLFIYDFTIFSIFIASSLLYLLWIVFFLKHRRKLDIQRFELASLENSKTIQIISGITEIKLGNAETTKRWEWENVQASLFKLSFKSLSISQYQQSGAFFINQGKNILITYLAAKAVIIGDITLGTMLAIQYIIGALNSPIEQLINFISQGQDAKLSLERLNEIHKMEDEEKSDSDYLKIQDHPQDITLSNLSFTYPGIGNLETLKNIDLEFQKGKVTAIVGTSGSGKSTILKLIQKFYSNYSGEIKIGSNNFKYVRPSEWRSVCSSVMQEGYLFNDSIAKNIALGEEMPDYSKLVHCCEIACIKEFIETLPQGFNTKIGYEGSNISSGQRQRILLARAIYKDPKYFFLDEATNALDTKTEHEIVNNLNKFYIGRTVVIIAHRLSTVKNADHIIVLYQGKVVEEGKHYDLLENKGKYYQLVENQLFDEKISSITNEE